MEVIVGGFHTVFPMDDASRVGQARRHAAALAQELAFGEVAAGQLAIVVNELGTNLVRHATRGRLLVTSRGSEVEVVSIDEGPGIANVEQSLRDGFSTGGTQGTGLGAVRRLARSFDIHSSIPQGTIVVARVGHRDETVPGESQIVAGAISIPAPGETVCGDAWTVAIDGAAAALLVADGLGHGPDAAKAANAAVAVFTAAPFAALATQLQEAHTALRTTRGAAVSTLRLDGNAEVLRGAGAGNVMTRVVSGVFDRTLMTQHGTVGAQIRRVEETQLAWPPHAVVVVCTDGLESRWTKDILMPVLGRDPVILAATLLRGHTRGRDDATVVVLKRRD